MTRSTRLAWVGFSLFAAAAVFAATPRPAEASSAIVQVEEGAQIYAATCAACHQAAGEGISGAFPPLAGNPSVADATYVASVVRDGVSGPLEVLGVSYDAVMPPVALTEPEITAVAQYVSTLASSASTPTASTVAAVPETGDATRGHDMFVGAVAFANDGPACAACHTAGEINGLGGPGLGPDLTQAFDRLGGEAGLTGWLATPPSPVMSPLFAENALTEDEIADVVAYLGTARNEPQGAAVDFMMIIGLAGAIVLFAGLAIVSRGLRRTYVERLRSAA